MRVLARYPILLAGALITGALILTAVLSLVWTPLPPAQINILQRLKPPLEQGLLGTDQFGRDMASMLMAGAWNSLSTAFLAVAAGACIGSVLGLLAAAGRDLLQTVLMRICDVIFAVPPILSAMALGAFLGAGRITAIIAIGTFMIPVFARLTLAGALQIWTRPYVLAAIGMGRSAVRITLVHVLPNIGNQIIVQVTIQLGLAILTEAGLSFLGLGLAPPAPTWGRMLADAQTFIGQAPWLAVLPGAAILMAVMGFSLLGDGLRELLDPRAR
ncbi:ABC transporter permease [Rhizobium halophilum]|uniref:ABC transporter permease n=1 Tax=Rhizobium halophilum TaxID=2846852 RepID=UPI001EFDF36A|nr:ABC transporter permease [Rhizobium halophilum]MCF6367919.1 ABC transporter permease [Rhizobium halophilum]